MLNLVVHKETAWLLKGKEDIAVCTRLRYRNVLGGGHISVQLVFVAPCSEGRSFHSFLQRL